MNNEIDVKKIYMEHGRYVSDNDKTSIYSSKDEGTKYDYILNEKKKSECLQLHDFLSFGEKKTNNVIDTNNLDIKIETDSSVSNYDIDKFNSKKRQLFTCSQCPKVFSNSSAIAKHKLTHSDERKYVCEICSKTFKRQDHLNGHKHTHTTNKPHACHLCDRSYSDARSLRRHYESQHHNEVLRCKEQKVVRDSGGSSIDDGCSVEIFGMLDETKCIKCDVCGKAFKNQSALNGHMRLHGGYGPIKNGISGPGEQRLLTGSPEKGDIASSSIGCHSPTIFSEVTSIVSVPSDISKSTLHSLLTNRPVTTSFTGNHPPLEAKTHKNSAPNFDFCISVAPSTSNHSTDTPNISMDELCACLSPGALTIDLNTSCTKIQSSSHQSVTDTRQTEQNPSLLPQYSPNNQTLQHSSLEDHCCIFNYPTIADNRHLQKNNLIFNDANQEDHYQYHWNNGRSQYVPIKSSNSPKQWSCFNIPDNISESEDHKTTSATSTLAPISLSNNFQDLIMNLESIDPCMNLEAEWCKYSDGNDDTNVIAESSERESSVKKDIAGTVIKDNQPRNNEQPCDSLYQPSSSGPELNVPVLHRKNKFRPAPIFIPPQTSAHMSRLRSPRVWSMSESIEVKIPYTPPPMLSPQRKGSGLFNSVWRMSGSSCSTIYSWCTPLSGDTATTISNSYGHDSLVSSSSLGNKQISSAIAYSPVRDQGQINNLSWTTLPTIGPKNGEPEHFLYHDDYVDCETHTVDENDVVPTSATPRINIGPQYQAQIPEYYNGRRRPIEYRRDLDTLLWDPRQFKDTVENISSLDLLMKIASSPAVKSCGLNMEYTFHLLCKFKGDFEKTLQALLEDSFVVYDYVYAETTIWTTDEINRFQERLKKHDRDFMQVALDLKSYGINKSVKACVEFYYVWKQMNNVKDINRYRVKGSQKKHCGGNLAFDDDNCPSNNGLQSSEPIAGDSGYNLRHKLPSNNQKSYMSYSSYDYKTSGENSSREPSPSQNKASRNNSVANEERIKKPRPYHCSQCKRKFIKSKTLENHLRSHHGTNIV